MEWIKCKKKPIVIEAMELTEELWLENDNYVDGLSWMANGFAVKTLEGTMYGNIGDYLMKGIDGELYICERSIFKRTYEVLE